MEQTTIFDEAYQPIRRRQLMPVLLKVYCWLFIMVGVLLALLAFYYLESTYSIHGMTYRDYGLVIEFSIILVFPVSMATLLLLEWKWAIWYNLVIGALYFLYAIAAFIILAAPVMLFWGAILTFPYWIQLLEIRHRWQHTAISKS